jgi:hypothetical protein
MISMAPTSSLLVPLILLSPSMYTLLHSQEMVWLVLDQVFIPLPLPVALGSWL